MDIKLDWGGDFIIQKKNMEFNDIFINNKVFQINLFWSFEISLAKYMKIIKSPLIIIMNIIME